MSGRAFVAREWATGVTSAGILRNSLSCKSNLLLGEDEPINASAIIYLREENPSGKFFCLGISFVLERKETGERQPCEYAGQ